MAFKSIHVFGDGMTDVFHLGELKPNGRFEILETKTFPGGADNVYENLVEILKNTNIDVLRRHSRRCPNPYNDTEPSKLNLIRYIDRVSGRKILESYNVDQQDLDTFYEPPYLRDSPTTFVIADYNKGHVNYSPSSRQESLAKYLIVDSRYRTLDSRWFRMAEIKIWHCTGQEYHSEWAKNFDYVLHTNGSQDVVVRTKTSEIIIPVPQETKVVDTLGAGDTFTAMVAAYITLLDPPPDKLLEIVIQAVHLAIQACQEVIQIPYTAVTKHTLTEPHVYY